MNIRVFASGIALSASAVLCSAHGASATVPFVAKPAATQAVSLLVKLPLRNVAELEELTRIQSDPLSPQYRQFLNVAQFRARYSPSPSMVQAAKAVLGSAGLPVTGVDSQFIHVSAPVAGIERAFNVHLGIALGAEGQARVVADRALTIPRGLRVIGAAIVGLDYHLEARPQMRQLVPISQNRDSKTGQYWFDDLKQAYSYPSYTPFNGKGVTIATVGESDFSDSDAALYFNHELLGGKGALGPEPTLKRLNLGGAKFDPKTGISDEANIDIQQSAGSAPGATVIGVNIPSVGEGFLYGYSVLDESNAADIVSTSYGGCELFYSAAYNGGIDQTPILKAYHELFLQGNSQGITFLFSSGDEAGTPCPQVGYFTEPNSGKTFKDLPGTSFWSSDPNATSVGGTNLITTYVPGKLTSTYVRESEFRDTIAPIDLYGTGNLIGNASWGSGGGSSVIFKKPWYQNFVNTGSSMRSDPDVSMQMGGCPGYPVPVHCGKDDSAGFAYIGGQLAAFIGTSLSAPEFAGLLAVFEQSQGGVRLGNANGYIYRLARTNKIVGGATVFHQGIPGSNGVFEVPKGQLGYNAIVGVGTPIANNFLLLPFAPLAGDPQTPSNP